MAEETSTAEFMETEELPTEQEKLFTQADLDTALAKERAKAPSKEEMDSFRAWKESQQTEQERQKRVLEERDSARQRVNDLETELEQARRERLLLAKGISEDDLDYYAFKIGKMVTDVLPFEKAAEKFLKEHMKTGTKAVVSFGGQMPGNAPHTETINERINRQLRGGM